MYNYSISVLEIGLLLISLLDVIKYPCRDRCLRLLKCSLMFFRSHSLNSKYAYEIVRFLVHQICSLSIKSAHEEFYGLFVNTIGHKGSVNPCDLVMEHHVKKIKFNVKHMNSGANEDYIEKRASANGVLSEIGSNIDIQLEVVDRYQSNHHVTSVGDLQEVISILIEKKLFDKQAGRSHSAFKNFPDSLWTNIDLPKMKEWLIMKIEEYAFELGN